jgi:hypothetical protein
MTHRTRASKHAASGQRLRGSQSSKPRHIPDVTGHIPYNTSYSMEQDSLFSEAHYALSSTQSEYSSQGHVQESRWSRTGHQNPPSGDASFAYLGAQGDFPPSYDSSMAAYGQLPPSYTPSMESSTTYADAFPWTSSNGSSAVDSSLELPMDSDYDMLSGNALSQSSPGLDFTSLSAEVDRLPAHQSSDAMYPAPAFISNSPFCYGTLPVGMQAMTNNIHTLQRTTMESFSQPWPHSQQNAGISQQMPPTPPASDYGTPPSAPECSSLSSEDPGQDARDQHVYLRSQERPRTRHPLNSLEDITPYNTYGQIHRSAYMQRTWRPAANLAQYYN